MRSLLSLVALVCLSSLAGAVELPELLLWPDGAPGAEGRTSTGKVNVTDGGGRFVTSVDAPTITPFLPAKEAANGCAILVIPGGGHRMLCVDHEGANIAEWFAEHGIAAFMLKHRLAREAGSTYTIEAHAFPDAQRAMRFIRAHAGDWGIDPARLGAIGFSAGGELVNLISLRPGAGKADAADPVEQQDARPAFQALIYPGGSGKIVPTKETPPAFLACGEKDRQDISEGLPQAYLRFREAGVSAELHVYAEVGHGFGYRPKATGAVTGWPSRFVEWLATRKMLTAKE